MTGTINNRAFEASVIAWMREVRGLTTLTRPEEDLGNHTGHGVLWGWRIERRRGGRVLFAAGVLILFAMLAFMLTERTSADAPLTIFGTACVLGGTVLGVVGNRLFSSDRQFVSTYYYAGRQIGEAAVWEAADAIAQATKEAKKRNEPERWLVSEQGFTRRGLVAAQRANLRCFARDGKRFQELDRLAQLPAAANDDGSKPPTDGDPPKPRPRSVRRVA